ncbi:hypothetical protein SRHO_G00110370 [Serrasalmus rhombeus]
MMVISCVGLSEPPLIQHTSQSAKYLVIKVRTYPYTCSLSIHRADEQNIQNSRESQCFFQTHKAFFQRKLLLQRERRHNAQLSAEDWVSLRGVSVHGAYPPSLPKDTPQASDRHQTSITACGLSSSDN